MYCRYMAGTAVQLEAAGSQAASQAASQSRQSQQMAWLLVAIHAFVTCVLVGLIWTIQLVHYPLFAAVGAENFVAYEQRHTHNITLLVAPLMAIEAVLAALISSSPPAGSSAPSWVPVAGLTLLAVIWGSTMALQVPCHADLQRGFKAEVHETLVHTNWIRTVAWTARGILSMWMLSPSGASKPPTRDKLA